MVRCMVACMVALVAIRLPEVSSRPVEGALKFRGYSWPALADLAAAPTRLAMGTAPGVPASSVRRRCAGSGWRPSTPASPARVFRAELPAHSRYCRYSTSPQRDIGVALGHGAACAAGLGMGHGALRQRAAEFLAETEPFIPPAPP